MILDSSAVVSIVFREPGFDQLIRKLQSSETRGMGTPTLVETGIVLTARLRSDVRPMLARIMQELQVVPVPFGEPHWREALAAYERFGKGRHPAALNFGDCLSYSTSRLTGMPLLFTGDDFTLTDVEIA